MGDQKFTCGRYKDKTFEEVFQNDRKFCENVSNSSGSSKYCPREFREYLKSKIVTEISERLVGHFVNRWSSSIRSEFEKLIGDLDITQKQIHLKSNSETNGDVGIFYRMFVRKCILNLKNEDARLSYAEQYATVFPFKVTKNVHDANIPVLELFDEDFYNNVGEFMTQHFDDVSVAEVVELLLKNVYLFRLKNFTHDQFLQLKTMYNSNFSGQSFGSGDKKSRPVCKYLNDFPRLNYAGVRRYDQFCQIYKQIFKMYHEKEPPEVSEKSWRCLPEINCFELLCLLEADFFTEKRVEYEKLFKKYLFFFNGALNSEEKPVFFIDQLLYECLKNYETFKKSRSSPQELQFVLWMMSLVHRRKQNLDVPGRSCDRIPKETDMNNIQNYFESYPEIKTASVDLFIQTKLINAQIFITTPTTLLNVCFSRRERTKISDFFELLIKGALCPRQIEQLVIYNGYSGLQTSVAMPQLKNEILNFVSRHNRCDMSVDVPAEEFITCGMEQYFEKYTINWQKKKELSESK